MNNIFLFFIEFKTIITMTVVFMVSCYSCVNHSMRKFCYFFTISTVEEGTGRSFTAGCKRQFESALLGLVLHVLLTKLRKGESFY